MNVQGGNKHSREVCFGQVKEEIQGKKINGECSVCFFLFFLFIYKIRRSSMVVVDFDFRAGGQSSIPT